MIVSATSIRLIKNIVYVLGKFNLGTFFHMGVRSIPCEKCGGMSHPVLKNTTCSCGDTEALYVIESLNK